MSEDKEREEEQEQEEDTGVCSTCPAAPDCDYASHGAPRCFKENK